MLIKKLSFCFILFLFGCCDTADCTCKIGNDVVIKNGSTHIEGKVIDLTKNSIKLDDNKWYAIDNSSFRSVNDYSIEKVK